MSGLLGDGRVSVGVSAGGDRGWETPVFDVLEPLLRALETEDFGAVATCLAQLEASDRHNPWIALGTARLYEARGDFETAADLYRQLLQEATGQKLLSQARQGIARVERLQTERRQIEIATARERGSIEPGALVLGAVASEAKQAAAQHLARVTGIDAYAARLQLPSRGLRPLRVGPLGELEFFAQLLQEGGIPCFCRSLAALQPQVVSVAAIEPVDDSRAIAHPFQGEPVTFTWESVGGRVLGEIPLPGEVVAVHRRSLKTYRKTETLDYARFCDLHLSERQIILRLSDRHYDFQRHAEFLTADTDSTGAGALTRAKWNRLLAAIAAAAPEATPDYNDFNAFAGAVKDSVHLQGLLAGLEPHIELDAARVKLDPAAKRQEALWDATFMLYSSLALLQPHEKASEAAAL